MKGVEIVSDNNYDLYLDRTVIDKVSYKEKDLLCILAILLECAKNQLVYGSEECIIHCTPSTLWANITQKVKITRTDKKNFIDSINRLITDNVVTVVESNTKDIKWSTLLKLDTRSIIHDSNRTFVCIKGDDLDGIKYKEYSHNTLATVLQIYVAIVSYFNMQQIEDFDTAIAANKMVIDENYDLYGQLDYHVSCWASHNRLMTTRHSSDTPGQPWISKPSLIEGLNLLEELGLICIVSVPGITNHYCFPRHEKYVKQIAQMQAKQIAYSKKKKQED